MYEKILQNISDQIEGLEKIREFVSTLPEIALPTDPKAHYWLTGNPGYIGINLPYDHALIEQNKQIMESAGYEVCRTHQATDDGVLHVGYRKGDWTQPMVDFFYRPKELGSTCKLNILGYEQKPIYEVTCMDAEPLVAAETVEAA